MDDLNDPKPARTDKEILEEARDRLKKCIDDYATERTKQKDDLLFSTLDKKPTSRLSCQILLSDELDGMKVTLAKSSSKD